MEDRFIEIFTGLKRAHGCTYINTTPKGGVKLKTKSFVKREQVQTANSINKIHTDLYPE